MRYDFPCILSHCPYGFGLAIFGPHITPGITPDRLLFIENQQFPFKSAQEGFAGQSLTLRELSRLTHRQRNKDLLVWSGFEALHDPDYYAY